MNFLNKYRVLKTLQKQIDSKFIATTCCSCGKVKAAEEKDFYNVLNKAEKVVGYPTSFLSLRWLVNDEIANIVLHLRKIVGTNHPLLNTARSLLLHNDLPKWGLIVLLISKAAGHSKSFSLLEKDPSSGILNSQRVLAEVTEMIRMSNYLHKGLININEEDKDAYDLNFGNKLALLSGDYLLSKSFQELALLKNHELNEVISSTLRDLAESEFIEPRDPQNNPLPQRPKEINPSISVPNNFTTAPFKLEDVLGHAEPEWTLRTLLSGGSLLAKSCQGAMILAGHPSSLHEQGYHVGRNLALAWQASLEKEIFKSKSDAPFSLVSAPVLFHLQNNADFYDDLLKFPLNFSRIKNLIVKGKVGLEKTEEMQETLSKNVIKALHHFPKSKALVALTNIVNAL